MIGQIVNGYTIIRKLGEGGMGEVYFAQDGMGQKAAIKIMRDEYRNRVDLRARFMTEMKAMISLQGHPNIVELKSTTGVGDGVIIMEYLEGQDLYRYVKEKGEVVDEKTLIEWAKQIIFALEFAHSKGIIHRDIKPSNIFLTKFNVIKVLDFGIAKVIQQNENGTVDDTLLDDLTKTRANLGAPQYMSPEQTFDPKLVTHLSDIYSFGKTLNYLATGGNPMIKPSSALNNIIKKCIEQCPDDRYQSWSEIRMLLNEDWTHDVLNKAKEYKTFSVQETKRELPCQRPEFRLMDFSKTIFGENPFAGSETKEEMIGDIILSLQTPMQKFVSTLKPDEELSRNKNFEDYKRSNIFSFSSETADRVKRIIIDKLGVDDSEVVPEARIGEDLGADSLDAVELVMEIEKEFNICISDDEAEKIRTVGDAISYVEMHI